MPETVTIVECPRDAWQGLPGHIPAETKAGYLRELIGAGFRQIDAVSFVSPTAVPQMADSEAVLQLLPVTHTAEIIGIVVNARGAERAVETGRVHTLGFPYSISPTFLERNQRQTQQQAIDALKGISALAGGNGLGVVAYISMAFGNPYGDAWSALEVVDACRRLADLGIRQISLADTVGMALPAEIAAVLGEVFAQEGDVEVGAHLHARPDRADAVITAVYQAGCRRFDSALGGLGGCPFAQDALVGNIATERLVRVLGSLGAKLPLLSPLDGLLDANARIACDYGNSAHAIASSGEG
jgi:hydroxymethylglutaryl-CoA lyase